MNSGLASTARLRSKPGPRDAVEQGSNRLGWPARVGVGVWYREIPPLRNQKFADSSGGGRWIRTFSTAARITEAAVTDPLRLRSGTTLPPGKQPNQRNDAVNSRLGRAIRNYPALGWIARGAASHNI